MVDQQSGNHAKFLRASGLRLDDNLSQFVKVTQQSPLRVSSQIRAHLLFICSGKVRLKANRQREQLAQGTTLAVENGHTVELCVETINSSAEVFVSSIGANYAYIQKLPNGRLRIDANETPYSTIIGLMVNALKVEAESERINESVSRRLNEVIMLQLIKRVQAVVVNSDAPEKIQHDEYLLRAWTAFFANPSYSWSVEALAAEAGLSRSAFFERFQRTFDASPIKTLRKFRLQQAKKILFSSRAPLLDIAHTIGYSSSAAFVRAFKKEFNITPEVWRNQSANRD